MPGRTTLQLTNQEKRYLKRVIRKRTSKVQEVERAKMLLFKAEGLTYDQIAERLNVHRNTVILCLSKYAEGGVECALQDKRATGKVRGSAIEQEAKDWVISLASKEPRYVGVPESSWSNELLTSYVSKNAVKAGFPRLENISGSTIRHILHSVDYTKLKMRANDKRRHEHDKDVQLMLQLDDLIPVTSAGDDADDWDDQEPYEQLSMMFDLGDETDETEETDETDDEDINSEFENVPETMSVPDDVIDDVTEPLTLESRTQETMEDTVVIPHDTLETSDTAEVPETNNEAPEIIDNVKEIGYKDGMAFEDAVDTDSGTDNDTDDMAVSDTDCYTASYAASNADLDVALTENSAEDCNDSELAIDGETVFSDINESENESARSSAELETATDTADKN